MIVVADTTVLIDVLRGVEVARGFLKGLKTFPACSEVTRIEATRGLRSHQRGPAEKLFRQIEFVDVDEGIARRAGELGRRWGRSHTGIGVADLAVAATVERMGGELATANVKHFPMFPGLQRPY